MLQRTRCFAGLTLVTAAVCIVVPFRPAMAQSLPQAPEQTPATAPLTLPTYKINPGDVLEISVFQKPTLSKTVTVPPDGKIYYPFLGEMNVAGLTLGQVTQRLTAGLSKELSAPQVSVAIIKQRTHEVSALGAVRSPGKQVMRDSYRLLDLIADCGGLSVARPEWASARLVRSGGAQAIKVDLAALMTTGDPEQNLALGAGDVLLVEEVEASRVSVQILGEVKKPGSVVVPRDGSLASVINAAGGFTPQATLTHVNLMRGGKSFTMDLRKLMETGEAIVTDDQGGTLQAARVEPGDTIMVARNRQLYSVTGAVVHPGPVEYPENLPVTVLSALSLAGGARNDADLRKVTLVRPTPGSQPEVQTINVENVFKNQADKSGKTPIVDVELRPGDMLYLPTRAASKRGFSLRDVLPALGIFNFINRL